MNTPPPPDKPIRNRLIPFDPECMMFLIPLIVIGWVGVFWGWIWISLPCALLVFAVLAFFRDPARAIAGDSKAIVSPADGKVVEIVPNEDPARGPVPGTKVAIFLSVLNCHVNRAPCGGKVEKIRYQRGKFLDARDPKSGEENECNWIFIRSGERQVVVRQIAGLIARRIVCRVREGQSFSRGERVGLIRFGSRTELYLPADAEIKVKVGDTVKGALDIIAVWREQ